MITTTKNNRATSQLTFTPKTSKNDQVGQKNVFYWARNGGRAFGCYWVCNGGGRETQNFFRSLN